MNWSDLSEKDKSAIKREYESGKEPGDIAPKYGLKPKQVSDQAYRKNWGKKSGSKKKTKKKAAKKAKKKAAKKKATKKKRRR